MTMILSIALGVVAALLIVFAVACLGIAAVSAWRQQVKRMLCFTLLAIVAAPGALFFWGLALGTGEQAHQLKAATAD